MTFNQQIFTKVKMLSPFFLRGLTKSRLSTNIEERALDFPLLYISYLQGGSMN
jgi:hypothetical protein